MSKPMAVTEAQFDREVLRAQTPVLVDFWAPWCGPCQMIAPTLEELAKAHAGVFKIVKVNVDEDPGLARKYGVMGIPTLLVFSQGRPVDRMVGLMPRHQLEERMMSALPARGA